MARQHEFILKVTYCSGAVGVRAIRGGVGAFRVGNLDFGAGVSSEGVKTARAALIFLTQALFTNLKTSKNAVS
jgi:hypothetical protein